MISVFCFVGCCLFFYVFTETYLVELGLGRLRHSRAALLMLYYLNLCLDYVLFVCLYVEFLTSLIPVITVVITVKWHCLFCCKYLTFIVFHLLFLHNNNSHYVIFDAHENVCNSRFVTVVASRCIEFTNTLINMLDVSAHLFDVDVGFFSKLQLLPKRDIVFLFDYNKTANSLREEKKAEHRIRSYCSHASTRTLLTQSSRII